MSSSRAEFDAARFARRLPARQALGRTLVVLPRTPSTHEELRAECARLGPAADGLCFVAEEQTSGRGRRARDWWSGPPRANLAVSLALARVPRPVETLTLQAACALAEAVRPETGRAARLALKWPNDLLVDGAKVAGILAESRGDGAVLSVGVNLAACPPAHVAPYPVAALGPAARREELLARLLLALERRLAQTRRAGSARLEADFLRLLRAWAPHGVREPRSGEAGALLGFSVRDGLAWGGKGGVTRRPLGAIAGLEALPAPTRTHDGPPRRT